MLYLFEGHCLDPSRRELWRGDAAVVVEPQVFDLLEYLIRHRERVVGRDDLLAAVWKGRIVSESTLASRIFAARQAIGDDGQRQQLIRTLARKGLRFVAAVADAHSRSHPFTLVSALLAQARFCSHVRDLPGAIAAAAEGAAIAAEQRSPYHLSRAAILQAINEVDGGRGATAIGAFEQALAAHRATGADFQSAYNLSRLAEAHAQAGDIDTALAHATRAIAEVERSGERWWLAEAWRGKGEILLQAGQAAPAQACLRRARVCARRQRARLWELQAALSLAELWLRQDRCDAARRLLRPLCTAFDDDVDLPQAAQARALVGRLRVDTSGARRSP